jgi:hypothetical protein
MPARSADCGFLIARGLAVDAHFARRARQRAENRLGDFGATGADESGEPHDLAGAQRCNGPASDAVRR